MPEPTDSDWHWWGKLDDRGSGVVVVVRGSGGEDRRVVNIPWVQPATKYRLVGVFSGKRYGVLLRKQLQERGVSVALPVFGQKLLEIAAE